MPKCPLTTQYIGGIVADISFPRWRPQSLGLCTSLRMSKYDKFSEYVAVRSIRWGYVTIRWNTLSYVEHVRKFCAFSVYADVLNIR